jgi:adsorption protein B
MIATLFFLINRVVHRFAATYNWYGFKYAAMSIVRLLFDNLINLFATMRAIRVYNTNKKQIVWDSTDHY